MKIHCLTLSWNGLDKLQRLYPTLITALQKTNLPFTWHIRDNGSQDQTVAEVSTWEHVTVYPINHNRDNFAQGMNYLFQQCQAQDEDLILLLNNDLFFGDEDSLQRMIEVLHQPDVGWVGARILYPESNLLQHAGVVFLNKYNKLPFHHKHRQPSTKIEEQNREFQAVTAAVALTTAEVYRKIFHNEKSGRNGMHEGYFWCFEDVDACLSVKYKQNKKIMYCGQTVIYHEESASLKKNPVNKMMMPQNVKLFRQRWDGVYQIEG